MNVVVMSLFRNAGWGQAQRFMAQAETLRDALAARGDRMRLVAVYGDCRDNTKQVLLDEATNRNFAMTLSSQNHGHPVFGSTEDPLRLKCLSYVINGGLECILKQDDVLVYVESDLLWDAPTILSLVDRLKPGVDIVAPLVFAGEHFYDVFVYRKNGERFGPFHPYHSELNHQGELTPVDSAGSCLVMRGEVARKTRITNDQALLGFCENAWGGGYTIHVDASLRINHP